METKMSVVLVLMAYLVTTIALPGCGDDTPIFPCDFSADCLCSIPSNNTIRNVNCYGSLFPIFTDTGIYVDKMVINVSASSLNISGESLRGLSRGVGTMVLECSYYCNNAECYDGCDNGWSMSPFALKILNI